jgi:hypothetical protein
MSPQRGDNLGGERGSDTGVSLSPSPVALSLYELILEPLDNL